MMKKSAFINKMKKDCCTKLLLLLVVSLLTTGCSKDDDDILTTGYFPKTINIGEGAIEFKFEYNEQNQIVRENMKITSDHHIMQYAYNDVRMVSKIWKDDKIFAEFEYVNGIMNAVTIPANETELEQVIPVTYSDGKYSSTLSGFSFLTDESEQLLHHEALNITYSYTDAPGIYQHLKLQPARFVGEMGAFAYYNLMVSNDAVATIDVRGKLYDVRNKKDENGNITQVEMIENATGTIGLKWDITYEERIL